AEQPFGRLYVVARRLSRTAARRSRISNGRRISDQTRRAPVTSPSGPLTELGEPDSTSDACKQPGAEAVAELVDVVDAPRGLGHVVLDPLELEAVVGAVVDRVAGPRVVVARLADAADADHVAVLGADVELAGDDLEHALAADRERLAQVRVADEGGLAEP